MNGDEAKNYTKIDQKKMALEARVNELVVNTHHEVVRRLKDVLLDLIFKPNNKSFNIERVIDVIN